MVIIRTTPILFSAYGIEIFLDQVGIGPERFDDDGVADFDAMQITCRWDESQRGFLVSVYEEAPWWGLTWLVRMLAEAGGYDRPEDVVLPEDNEFLWELDELFDPLYV